MLLAFLQECGRDREIGGAGDLEIRGGALDEPGSIAQPLDRLRLIGWDAARRVRAVERLAEAAIAEHLWCQRAPESCAIDGLLDLPGAVGPLQRVGCRRGEQPADGMARELRERSEERRVGKECRSRWS